MPATNATRGRLWLLAALVVGATTLGGCGGSDQEPDATGKSMAAAKRAIEELPTAKIAKRVEKLRGERFKQPPTAEVVTAAESKRHFAAMAAELPPRDQLLAEEQLKLIGALPAGSDLEGVGSAIGNAALGFYESPPPRIALVASPLTEDPKTAATVFAHEATHALADQYFDIFRRIKALQRRSADESVAFGALVEGDATAVTLAYAEKYGGAPSEEEAAEQAEGLPFILRFATEFIYAGGAEFVEAIAKDGGAAALARAFENPPISSAQILHPELYLKGVEPTRPSIDAGAVLGGGWNRVGGNTYGELDVLAMLAFDEDQVEAAAPVGKGWRGGRVELWRKGPVQADCRLPCTSKDALIIALDWASPTDAEEFDRAFERSLVEERDAEPAGEGFDVAGGGVASSSRGTQTKIAYAPTAQLASQLTEGAR